MIVDVDLSACKHLHEMSRYNSNYYLLPFEVNFCDVVFESYGGDETLNYYSLGKVVNGKFEEKYFLNDDLLDCYGSADRIRFNSEKLSDTNEYT